MKIKNFLKTFLSFILNFKESKFAFKKTYSTKVLNNKTHLLNACRWLMNSQNAGEDDGFSRHYSLYSKKWDESYIETTGYIIPTLVSAGNFLEDEKYKASALKAGKWLLQKQNLDGSFNDIDKNIPQVFDTGQCLIGLNFLYKETNEREYLEAGIKASNWLIDCQAEDGSWTKNSYNNLPHSYYSRVGAALMDNYSLSKNKVFYEKGLKNINWCIAQQKRNGFFKYSSFDSEEKPFLHTLIYIIEGLIDAYKITKKEYILNSIIKLTSKLKKINLERDIILFSRYDDNFESIDKSKCITGLAQWAGICIELYSLTDDEDYFRLASRTIYYLKSKHLSHDNPGMNGGFFGSVPFYGDYGACKVLNWNNKFFIDAILKYEKFKNCLDDDHSEWVRASFELTPKTVVKEELDQHDFSYFKEINKIIENILFKKNEVMVLDLGCGKGKFLEYLISKYPQISFLGVDPVYMDNQKILNGNSSKIPLEDKSVDLVICIEVLQHERSLEAPFKEIKRVLKDDGFLFIGDRNKVSFLGVFKKTYEILGKWMYIKDSPFVEKWYSLKDWIIFFNINGFVLIDIKKINIFFSKIPLMNRYYAFTLNKNSL